MAQNEDSVVCVKWTRQGKSEGFYTTGCVVAKSNTIGMVILTCSHQIDSLFDEVSDLEDHINHYLREIKVVVEFSNSVNKEARVLATDIVDDLTLVCLPIDDSIANLPAVQEFKEETMQPGEDIQSVFHRGIMKYSKENGQYVTHILLRDTYSNGFVSHGARSHPELGAAGKEYVEYWLPIAGPVSSGASIFDGNGRIVANHAFGIQGVKYGIPVSIIKGFFEYVFDIEDDRTLDEIVRSI